MGIGTGIGMGIGWVLVFTNGNWTKGELSHSNS